MKITYLKNNYNMRRTAECLHLHLNTLKYRLKRIEELLDINIKDVDACFNLQLVWNIIETLAVKEKWLNLTMDSEQSV